jgi:hypothetical protein
MTRNLVPTISGRPTIDKRKLSYQKSGFVFGSPITFWSGRNWPRFFKRSTRSNRLRTLRFDLMVFLLFRLGCWLMVSQASFYNFYSSCCNQQVLLVAKSCEERVTHCYGVGRDITSDGQWNVLAQNSPPLQEFSTSRWIPPPWQDHRRYSKR